MLGVIDSVSLRDACKKAKGIRYRGPMSSKNKQLTESLGEEVMSFFLTASTAYGFHIHPSQLNTKT